MRSPQKLSNPHLLAVAIATAMSSSTAFSAEQVLDAENASAPRELTMIEVKGQATGGIDILITSDELEKLQANDLADVFHLDPQVSTGGSVGMGQKLYLRNIGEDALNISIDGAEQAGAVFHHSGRIAIEPDLLKQVEVEAGPGSATAGPGALGGSIRFTTKDPEDLLAPSETAGALIKGTYYSNSEGYKATTSVFGRDKSDTLSILASFADSDHSDVKDGKGDDVVGSESKQQMGYAKLVANLTDEQKLSISYEKLNEKGDILYKPELIASPRNVPEPTEGSRDTTTLNYGMDSNGNDLVDVKVTLYTTKNEQERDFRGVSYDGAVETFGGTIQNTSVISSNKLIYGINYRDDKSYLNDVDFADSYFEETGTVKGIYVQDVFEINDQLTFSTGVRFDDYELKDVNGQNFKDSGFSFNASTNYAITDEVSISAGYAEALRGAEVKDAFKLSSSSNADDLEAEKAKNYEIGLDFNRGSLNLAVGAYLNEIENPIGGTLPWSRVSENLDDDIETLGYFIRADYVYERLFATANFNSATTKTDKYDATRYIHGSTATSKGNTLVTDVSYDLTQGFMVGWAAEFVQSMGHVDINLDDDDGKQLKAHKSGYSVHDVYTRWSPMSDDTFSLTLTVKNMFNKQYLDHSSVEDLTSGAGYENIVGSSGSGRDIRMTASLRI